MLKMKFSLVLATLLCFTKWMSMVQASEYSQKYQIFDNVYGLSVWCGKTKGI